MKSKFRTILSFIVVILKNVKIHLLKFENPLILVPTIHIVVIIIQFLFLTNILENLLLLNNFFKEIWTIIITLNTNFIELYYSYCNVNLINYKDITNDTVPNKNILFSPSEKKSWYNFHEYYYRERGFNFTYRGKYWELGALEECEPDEKKGTYEPTWTEEFDKEWDFKPISDKKEYWWGLAGLAIVGFLLGSWLASPPPLSYPEGDVRNLKKSDILGYLMSSRYSIFEINEDDGTFPVKINAPEPPLHVSLKPLPTWLGDQSLYIGPSIEIDYPRESIPENYPGHFIHDYEKEMFKYLILDRTQGPAKSQCFDRSTGELLPRFPYYNQHMSFRNEVREHVIKLLRDPNNWIKYKNIKK